MSSVLVALSFGAVIVLAASQSLSMAAYGTKILISNVFQGPVYAEQNTPRPDDVVSITTGTENGGSEVSDERLESSNLTDQYTAVGVKDETSTESPNVAPTKISSDAYLVADVERGEILLEKNSASRMHIASISKLITAILATDKYSLDSVLTVSREAVETYGQSGGLQSGERLTLRSLLHALLLESSNDAAEAIAINAGRLNFVRAMNAFAITKGMLDTEFEDPSGLGDNISTAKDLYILAKYIFEKRHDIIDVTAKKVYSDEGHNWKNPVKLLAYDSYLGGKNGYTDEAGRTSLAFFDLIGSDKKHHTIVVIVLDSENRESDVLNLLEMI